MPRYPQPYIDLMTAGPFPDGIDPWAEAGRYFHQLHSEIISHMLGQIREPLLRMGYVAGRETSLQIAENRQPDVYVQRMGDDAPQSTAWNYAQAAEAILAEPGILLTSAQPELDALYIKDVEVGNLVTVVEVVSPRNENDHVMIRDYQERRSRLLGQQVNVVEVDLIRSVKRLIDDPLVAGYPYHVAVHLSNQPPRLIGMKLTEPLKRFAIPLRNEVTPVELQAAYNHAYTQTSLAWHIDGETGYAEDALTFPSTLTRAERMRLLKAVAAWQEQRQALLS